MRVELFQPGSISSYRLAQGLDRLLDHNSSGYISIADDRIVVAVRDDGECAAALIWRPTAWVHALHLPHTLGDRSVSESMQWDAAVRLDVGRRHRVTQAAFTVDSSNHRMLRYVREELKAAEQDPQPLFLLDLKRQE